MTIFYKFVKVENNEVVEILSSLPKTLKNVSTGEVNGNFSDPNNIEQQKEWGYYPYEETRNTINDFQIYDSVILSNIVYDSIGDKYTYTVPISYISLGDAKNLKKSKVNDIWDKKQYEGFVHNTKLYDSDPISLDRIMIASLATTAPTEWRAKDNTLNNIIFSDFVNDLADRNDELFTIAKNHKDSIDALSTTESVANYDINIGW